MYAVAVVRRISMYMITNCNLQCFRNLNNRVHYLQSGVCAKGQVRVFRTVPLKISNFHCQEGNHSNLSPKETTQSGFRIVLGVLVPLGIDNKMAAQLKLWGS